MTHQTIYHTVCDLPDTLPLLLVRGAILLPQSQLSLPVFDASQLTMMANVLKTDRLIGLIQPNITELSVTTDETPQDKLSLFSIGTAGKIVEITDGEEGRMIMSIHGICRFTLLEQKDTTDGYPIGQVSYNHFEPDLAQDTDLTIDRERLVTALRPYFNHLDIMPNWDEIDQISNQKLMNALMMSCPFDPREKQALLESKTLTEQSQMMTTLIEMATFQSEHKSLTWH